MLSDGKHTQRVAKALALYLMDGGGDSPQERPRRQANLCDSVSRLLQTLMDGQPGWGSRYMWLDGIAPLTISPTGSQGLRMVGGAYVMDGPKARGLRPVVADLAAPPRASVLYFASQQAEVEFVQGRADRLVVPPDPATWPHVFEMLLA